MYLVLAGSYEHYAGKITTATTEGSPMHSCIVFMTDKLTDIARSKCFDSVWYVTYDELTCSTGGEVVFPFSTT